MLCGTEDVAVEVPEARWESDIDCELLRSWEGEEVPDNVGDWDTSKLLEALCVHVRKDEADLVIVIDRVPLVVKVGLCDLLGVGDTVTLQDGVVT